MVRQEYPSPVPANGKGEGDSRPSDKRYKLLEATMRKHGYAGNALIESLHTAQQAFGYLDDFTLWHIARSLHLPPSKVYGVATFYNHFTLKPQGEHTCVVCLGTACYIKGARAAIAAIEAEFQVRPGSTTADGKLSLLTARCFGSCALAPAAMMDGEMLGKLTPASIVGRIEDVISEINHELGRTEQRRS